MGRRSHTPDPAQRRQVAAMAAYRIPADDIYDYTDEELMDIIRTEAPTSACTPVRSSHKGSGQTRTRSITT